VTEPTIEPCAAVRVRVPAETVESVSDRLWWLGANAIGEEADGDLTLLTAGFDTLSAARSAVQEMPELVPEGWIPRYPDYLFLSFTNATAFSPTDTLPLRIWAKMTMIVESVISLITAILVIARAINVLPG